MVLITSRLLQSMAYYSSYGATTIEVTTLYFLHTIIRPEHITQPVNDDNDNDNLLAITQSHKQTNTHTHTHTNYYSGVGN